MKRIALLMALLATGCTATEYMGRRLTPDDEAYIRGKHPFATLDVVVTREGVPTYGRITRVSANETQVAVSGAEVTVGNAFIEEIRVRNHLLGGLEGAGIGLVSGAAGGAALLYAACPTTPDGCVDWADRGGMAIFGAVLFGIVGTVVGVIVGGARGDTTTYWYDSSRRE